MEAREHQVQVLGVCAIIASGKWWRVCEMDKSSLLEKIGLLDLPIGAYIVAPDGHFIACNRSVRELLGLPLQGDIQASIADFYADQKVRADLVSKAIAADETGVIEKETIPLRVNGREIFVEDYCKPLRDDKKTIVGFVGCLVDITDEHRAEEHAGVLQHKVEELTFDIGRILHANTSTLLMAQQTLDGVAEALSQRPLKEVIATPPEELDDQMIKEAGILANALERLLHSVEPARRVQALPESEWEMLQAKITPLTQVRELVPGMEMRVPALRGVAHQVTVACRAMATGTMPRELVREVMRAASQLESTACLIDVLLSRMAIIQMDGSLRSLRDYITSDIRTQEQRKRLSIKQLTDQSITHLAEFARSSRVEIVRRDLYFDAYVEGVERDLVRALSNLLHNAIKYSWRRDRAKAPWITVRTYASEGMACIEFENWGVPIAQEEIDNGLIFQIGYRGKWSKDRGRLGTGIGLTDAKRTALQHHGDLRVASRPANPGWVRPSDPEYYNQPFITTVTLSLPQATK